MVVWAVLVVAVCVDENENKTRTKCDNRRVFVFFQALIPAIGSFFASSAGSSILSGLATGLGGSLLSGFFGKKRDKKAQGAVNAANQRAAEAEQKANRRDRMGRAGGRSSTMARSALGFDTSEITKNAYGSKTSLGQ